MNLVNRRHFVALSSAAALGATFFDVPKLLGASSDPFGGFPIGAQSYSLRNFTALEAIRHMQGMGIHFIEFAGKHLSIAATKDEIAEMHAVLKKADISISAHGVNGFTKDHKKNRAVFEFAKRAGIKNITANPEPDSFDSLD
ncbi:MAG: inosose dehydratase, partial [Pirellulaceae bacterium]